MDDITPIGLQDPPAIDRNSDMICRIECEFSKIAEKFEPTSKSKTRSKSDKLTERKMEDILEELLSYLLNYRCGGDGLYYNNTNTQEYGINELTCRDGFNMTLKIFKGTSDDKITLVLEIIDDQFKDEFKDVCEKLTKHYDPSSTNGGKRQKRRTKTRARRSKKRSTRRRV